MSATEDDPLPQLVPADDAEILPRLVDDEFRAVVNFIAATTCLVGSVRLSSEEFSHAPSVLLHEFSRAVLCFSLRAFRVATSRFPKI
jgi:hypothetical protein